ncbi:MmcQ/YjbR family DNA-binding protein [Desulfovibrio litoralis]|uniref:Predicted DNA-binding protein, MmcQ/YjbR family n=1 Tax=Desulfovibrio litoralis DSM 11393 TaxID=1121455 RepID=A0A1M7TIR1_9BACT|nr:MmcQ/YjbR family DNA-binding protein [Desulfovibrio litoralis]SHN70488.1 Predicted DNA-binding protein, MmcQ/YjbR family [Desulfovibrio litoralis DSM 11393]
MKYPWLDEYCQAKQACIKDFKAEWNATRYLVGNKMFALCGKDNQGREIITLKTEPHYGLSLRQENPDIIAGYYMNKMHWNSVFLDGNVPDKLLKEMIDESYLLIFNGLSKKLQKELKEIVE